jgi:branched-chain amino acid transport system permease protein
LFALQYLFSRTRLGRAFRAASDDSTTAQLMGIDNKHVYGIAMALAMAVVALAGFYLALRANVSPSEGPARLIYAFEAVIIGGMGSLWGTLVGGMILGVAQSIGLKLDPGWGILAGHLTFLTVLVFRPNGLFPKTRDR